MDDDDLNHTHKLVAVRVRIFAKVCIERAIFDEGRDEVKFGGCLEDTEKRQDVTVIQVLPGLPFP